MENEEQEIVPVEDAGTAETVAAVETPVETSAPVAPAETSAPDAPDAPLPPPKPREVRIPLPSSLQEIVGSLLFASEQPLTAAELRASIRALAPEEGDDPEVMGVYQSCTSREIDEALHGLEKELARARLGFHLVCTGGTYRLQTSPTCGRYVRALLKLDRPSRLSRASLETLAIIAYRQPITKAEVEQIRGVAVDTIVKTLVDLQLVRLVGKSELPGHPFLYGTTPLFLEHFGLSSLGDLNGIDPTLQRSDPKARAAAYRKPEPPPTEEKPTEEKPAGEKPAEETPAEEMPAVSEEDVEPLEEEENPDVAPKSDDEEDVYIDDTPDEFDDDDDDDDDDEDEEELDDEDGDEDEEELDDEDDDEDEEGEEEDENDEEK